MTSSSSVVNQWHTAGRKLIRDREVIFDRCSLTLEMDEQALTKLARLRECALLAARGAGRSRIATANEWEGGGRAERATRKGPRYTVPSYLRFRGERRGRARASAAPFLFPIRSFFPPHDALLNSYL